MDVKFIIFLITTISIAISYTPYFYGIFKGKVRPHPITWLSWAVVTTALALAYMFNGGGWSTWATVAIIPVDIAIIILAVVYVKEKIRYGIDFVVDH